MKLLRAKLHIIFQGRNGHIEGCKYGAGGGSQRRGSYTSNETTALRDFTAYTSSLRIVSKRSSECAVRRLLGRTLIFESDGQAQSRGCA